MLKVSKSKYRKIFYDNSFAKIADNISTEDHMHVPKYIIEIRRTDHDRVFYYYYLAFFEVSSVNYVNSSLHLSLVQ